MGAIQGAVNSIIGTASQAAGEAASLKEQKKSNEMAAENKKIGAINAANSFNAAAFEAEAQHKQNFTNEIAAKSKYDQAQKDANNKHPKDAKTGKFVRYDAQKAMEALNNANNEYETAVKQRELSYQRIKGLVANRDFMMKNNNLDSSFLTKQAFDLKSVNNVADALYEFERGGNK